MHAAHRTPHTAFSLVELSIVLVVLGLLVGGILAGKSLIRASELRRLITDYQKFYGATLEFKQKYFMLPGDITNATQFWGEAAVGAACGPTSTNDGRTCDGDGDGKIGSGASGSHMSRERVRFWQHLNNAGFLSGCYSGFAPISSDCLDEPRGRIGELRWVSEFKATVTATGGAMYGVYGNTLQLITVAVPRKGLLASEVWGIDVKLDDGMPATGKLTQHTGAWSDCSTGSAASDLSAEYQLDDSTGTCGFLFRNQF